jgi:hypothetical protein|tara:strand:+ start:198 stop:371 length:174 start_codon:yes stop_codon:yes gene_type:complete
MESQRGGHLVFTIHANTWCLASYKELAGTKPGRQSQEINDMGVCGFCLPVCRFVVAE